MTADEIKFEKKVDEGWKQKATEEKEQLAQEASKAPQEFPPPDFHTYLASLSAQALISLGQMENPMTKKKETDLLQGRYIIDILVMLKEKTKGNLSKEEEANFQSLISGLQLLYVKLNKKT
ncbi:MAG TPA: DUF1844 domain-containing protein [Planctomycetota bacterium]|nr:DUF1844 domain-containing protein [Planctomycetota bacterium]